MASNKRQRENNKQVIWSDFDNENEDPCIPCSPPRKIRKMVSEAQTSTSFPLRVKDGNVGSSLDGPSVIEGRKAKSGEVQEQHEKTGHAERNPSVYGEEGMSSGEDLKQDGELALPDKNQENLSARKLPDYFRKVFKPRSPQKPPKKSSDVVHQGENQKREDVKQLDGASAVLQERAKAVCLVQVVEVCQGNEKIVYFGTGFVLVDRYIITNEHVLRKYLAGYKLKENFIIKALFNYGGPDSDYVTCTAEKMLTIVVYEQDFAIFQVKPEGHKRNTQTRIENLKLPPGLLMYLVPKPKTGPLYIIGHQAGGPKQRDDAYIIEPKDREQFVNYYLAQCKDPSLYEEIKKTLQAQGIDRVKEGGDLANVLTTYISVMGWGSSGSPACDAVVNVFGLHTAIFHYGENYVVTYAPDLIPIAEKFVSNLRQRGDVQTLESLELMALKNPYLKQILEPEPMKVD